MLSTKLASTLLYAYPMYSHLIATYRRALKYLLSFEANTRDVASEAIFDRIFDAMDIIDNLIALRNAIATALGFLTPSQRAIIEGVYFKDMPRETLSETLGISLATMRSRKSRALRKLRAYLEILGFSDAHIVDIFDGVELFKECGRLVERNYIRATNLSANGDGYVEKR